MSTTPEGLQGSVIVSVRLRVKLGTEDDAEAALLAVRDSVLSDAEPEGVEFRVARYNNEFLLFEEYTSAAALKTHQETPAFKMWAELAAVIFDGKPEVYFYQE
ncbi:hypothetical protein FRB99_004340, partial [Tulasnella sp. 403]